MLAVLTYLVGAVVFSLVGTILGAFLNAETVPGWIAWPVGIALIVGLSMLCGIR